MNENIKMRGFLAIGGVLATWLLLTACTQAPKPQATPTPPPAAVMSVAQFQALPAQLADQRLAYGNDPNQQCAAASIALLTEPWSLLFPTGV